MMKCQKEKHHRIKNMEVIMLSVILFSCFFLSAKADASADAQTDIPRVLFISSYTESFEPVSEQIKGIQEVLLPQDISLDIEYMDTKKLDTKENLDLFYSILKYKLNTKDPYDGIIVGDDKALEFAMEHQKELFHNLPIIFLGINDFQRATTAYKNPYISGIVEETSLKDNIEIALKFNPKATKVIALVENSITGLGDKNQFYLNEDFFPELTFEDLNISEYTFDEMADKISSISDDTILLFLSMYTDKTGKYITMNDAAKFLKEHSNVPVYRASIGGIGKGLLGGKMISYVESGHIAAKMILDIFNGIPVETIEMVDESPNFYIFDYEVIEKFNIDKKLIPHDAILINEKVSFFKQHKQLVLGTLLIIFVLIIISTILIADNIKQKIMKRKLLESHEELSATYEELTAAEEELRTQYHTIEQHVHRTEILNQKYENAIVNTDSAVWEVNLDTRQIYFSENIDHLLQMSIKHFSNLDTILQLIPEKDARNMLIDEFVKYQNKEINYINIQIPIQISDSNVKWISIRGKGITDGTGMIHMFHGILTDTTKTREQEEYIKHLAHHDYLTDLPNRIYFTEYLRVEIEKEKPLAVILMDIDNFKSINDTLGHIYGDKILKEVANRLTEFKNMDTFFSRFGGDEFIIMICDTHDRIESRINAIMERLKDPIVIDHTEHHIKYSLGITCYPEDSKDITQLIMNADTAMYKSKHSGKNQYLFYNREMQEEVKNKAEINRILRKSIKEDGFYLVYQPQVSVTTGEIIGFEALLRLKEPHIPPNIFIPIAEETDLIFHIGRMVTHEAIRQAASWRLMGHSPKIISINFSSKQIRDKHYLEYLRDTLIEYRLEPEYLEIEITESTLMEESKYTLSFLERLKELGVKIALDDFGTGFSSINYLSYIPVDKVKLDKTLCDKFLGLKNNKVMSSIISLVHSFDINIIAEGIEEKKQYEQLRDNGCDMIQGYLFSPPVTAEEAEKIYDKNFFQK